MVRYRRILRWGLAVTDARLHHYLPTLGLGVLAATLDAAAMALLLPLVDNMAAGTLSASYPGWTWLTDRLQDTTIFGRFMIMLGTIFGLLIARSIAEYASTNLAYRRDTLYGVRMQSALLRRYLSFGQSFFDTESRGHVQRMMTFGETLLRLMTLAETLTAALLHSLSLFVVLLTISVRMTGVLVLTVPLVYVLTSQLTRALNRWSEEKRDQGLELGRRVYNIFSMVPLLKAYGQEDEVVRDHRALLESSRRVAIRGTGLATAVLPIQQTVQLAALFALAFAAVAGAQGGTRTTELMHFGAFLLVARRILPTFEAIADVRTKWAQARPDLDKLDEALADDGKGQVPDGTLPLPPITEGIQLRNLSFAYGERRALDGISLDIPAGQVTALVGPTGSGKSSVAHLLIRLYDAPAGAIRVDGQDLRRFTLASLRTRVTLVGQEPLLFHGSLRANISVGLSQPASDDEIRAALAEVMLEPLLRRLPAGLDTTVGDRGATLSGGEKQRLALARALLRAPEVLILDEATSALDAVTEAEVHRRLMQRRARPTMLVIAHRLATIRDADQIFVLQGGRVAERGDHARLLAAGGLYADLWAAQATASRPTRV